MNLWHKFKDFNSTLVRLKVQSAVRKEQSVKGDQQFHFGTIDCLKRQNVFPSGYRLVPNVLISVCQRTYSGGLWAG